MAKAYTREFLIDAGLHRYRVALGNESAEAMRPLFENCYDNWSKRDRTKFRQYASLTPERIKEYKEWLAKV